MKFIHLGDLHLGKNVNDFSMIEDQQYILDQIADIIEAQEIDAVLLAGDIYDRSIPSEEAVKLFDGFLTKLAAMGRSVFAVSGNHDSDERLHFGSSLFAAKNIYINGRYDGEIPCVTVEDDHGPLHIWLLPYIKASRVGHFLPEADTSTYDKAFRAVIDHADVDGAERNLLVLHQFVTGAAKEPELAGSETMVLNVGTIDKIGADCFDVFDYVAMGHIHRAQAVGRETCRYVGSMLKYSLDRNELAQTKTVPVITMGAKGDVEVQLIPLQPLREIRHIRGHLRDLIDSATDTEDYIYATLTDEETQFDAMARLQEVYPRVMKLDYDNAASRALGAEGGGPVTEGKSFHQLIGEFFQLYQGSQPGEKEWAIIEETAREAGVIE
ncbi:MAG: exonuclease SbcCD subunit D [Firmicutes bacterium]|nr:exonuclease SbcCD subunit D [Bacillota bacterium]